ncbi:hypothetical protein B4094_3444 [Bacillus licheniformis]|nr:hypothetical protein B4094_3444 [Bacillus licheniformis]OLF93524.1 hypothetical protein B4089_1634 [Bacillus licheniformis]TWL66662.1 hypothetical protein CHCC15320_1051 [Bacillus licheniformis]
MILTQFEKIEEQNGKSSLKRTGGYHFLLANFIIYSIIHELYRN